MTEESLQNKKNLFFCFAGIFTIFASLYDRMKKATFIANIMLLSLLDIQAQQLFTVVIDPGHGGKDPGSVGAIAYEKNINLSVALLLGNLIEGNYEDVKVVFTRKTDIFLPLDERANIANRNKADLFISIHANSVKRSAPSGAETFTLGLANSEENLEIAMRENGVILMEDDYLVKYEGFDPNSSESYIIFELQQSRYLEQSVSFASEIQKSFERANRDNRGVKQAGFLVLRKTSMASVLIELGFLSNRSEERFLASKEGQKELALSVYRAFSNYKYDYDRKSGSMNGRTIEVVALNPNKTETVTNNKTDDTPKTTATQPRKGEIVYKVQILTADKQLSLKDKRFKGYDEISYYVEKGVYKYTYGSTTDYSTIMSMYRKAAKDFKGAFVISVKDGKRIYQ